jgi:hypothetical protein
VSFARHYCGVEEKSIEQVQENENEIERTLLALKKERNKKHTVPEFWSWRCT